MRRRFMQALGAMAGYLFLPRRAAAQDLKRTDLKRADLTGTDMQIIVSVLEAPPGTFLARHTHPGEEAFYVLEGGMVQVPGRAAAPFPTGAANINVRDVPHAGVAVVGDRSLKLLTVHIVDKGKPVSTPAP